jgi:hypothetical protein
MISGSLLIFGMLKIQVSCRTRLPTFAAAAAAAAESPRV